MQRYTVYLYLETALHVSGGTSTHHQERIQLYLQHTQTGSNSSTIAADSSNTVTNTRCCRYSCLRSWWWVVVPPETCRAVSRSNKLCNVASCWAYIRTEEFISFCYSYTKLIYFQCIIIIIIINGLHSILSHFVTFLSHFVTFPSKLQGVRKT